MKILLTVFGIVIASLLCIVFMCYVLDSPDANYPKIKFKTFKHFYEINPSRWDLGCGCVRCNLGMLDYEYLKFGFIDFLRYQLWYAARDRYNTQKGQVESMSKVLAVVKEDIKNLEIFAEQQVNEGVDMINDILQETKK